MVLVLTVAANFINFFYISIERHLYSHTYLFSMTLSIRTIIMLIAAIYTILVAATAFISVILLQQENYSQELEAHKDEALSLAAELKQTSNDLTHFARTYAVTGEQRYYDYFQAIIAIRDGEQPGPSGYTRSYWDHIAAHTMQHNQNGERYSIKQRIIDLGLTTQEIAKLAEAKKESDKLTSLEYDAMKAVVGLYRDDSGQFTVNAAPDRDMAIRLLFSRDYHEAKSRIMKPIDDFFILLEERYRNDLNAINQNKRQLLTTIIVLILVTIFFSIYVFFIFKKRIITPLSTLGKDARLIQEGNYSHRIEHEHNDEIGVLVDSISTMSNTLTETLRSREIILDNAVVAIAQLIDNRICWVNSHMCKMFGYSLDEFKGKSIEFLHAYPDDFKRMNLESFPKMFQGKTFESQYQLRRKNGSTLWCIINGKAIAPDDMAKGVIYIIVNITEQKLAEQAILNAVEAAESANQAKSYFLDNVSHELRTPLSAIIGMTQLMLLSPLNKNQQSYANTTLEAANELLETINNTLDFSQIDSGKIQLEAIGFKVRETIANAAKTIKESAQKRNLKFTLDVADNVPQILNGDPKRLQELLIILGDNAVKFNEPGGAIAISVKLGDDCHNRFMLHFSVKDTGIGITQEQQGKIFTLFSQVDASSTRQYGGLGLGLALARKLVELMQGEIWVESKYGCGSTFHFVIPLNKPI